MNKSFEANGDILTNPECCGLDAAAGSSAVKKGVKELFQRFWRWQALVDTVQKERRELSELPQNILDDIGVDSVTAEQESRRKSWDLPDSRR